MAFILQYNGKCVIVKKSLPSVINYNNKDPENGQSLLCTLLLWVAGWFELSTCICVYIALILISVFEIIKGFH